MENTLSSLLHNEKMANHPCLYVLFLFSVYWLQIFTTLFISLSLGKAQDWLKSNKTEENPKYIIKQLNNVSWEKASAFKTIGFWYTFFLCEIVLDIINWKIFLVLFFWRPIYANGRWYISQASVETKYSRCKEGLNSLIESQTTLAEMRQ